MDFKINLLSQTLECAFKKLLKKIGYTGDTKRKQGCGRPQIKILTLLKILF